MPTTPALGPGSEEEEDMSCRAPSSADESRRALLPVTSPASVSAAELSKEEKKSAQPVSRFKLGLCLLALLSLFALSLMPQHKPGAPPKASRVITHAEPLSAILYKAGARALGGGLGGAVGGICQVLALMWLRTTMNYQYRHGGSMSTALRTLYAQGGIARFYQGLLYALMQTPLSRFGDTAANVGVLSIFASLLPGTPLGVRTAFASAAGASWRMLITPLDTCKTSLQVEGPAAYQLLMRKAQQDGCVERIARCAAELCPRTCFAHAYTRARTHAYTRTRARSQPI